MPRVAGEAVLAPVDAVLQDGGRLVPITLRGPERSIEAGAPLVLARLGDDDKRCRLTTAPAPAASVVVSIVATLMT